MSEETATDTSATMKAVHLYIGVAIGCTVLVGIAVSIDRRITKATDGFEMLKSDVADIKTANKETSNQLQALRLDLQGVKFEANGYMNYQDERRERTSGVKRGRTFER